MLIVSLSRAEPAEDGAVRVEIDRDPARFQGSPLAGVPVALKDNLCTTDYPTTCASHVLARERPRSDATVVASSRDQS